MASVDACCEPVYTVAEALDSAPVQALGMLAEVGGGPMHMGAAITLEGAADFDSVAIVFYPGAQFFADMLRSRFFTGGVGNKQLGDTYSSPSFPLLSLL